MLFCLYINQQTPYGHAHILFIVGIAGNLLKDCTAGRQGFKVPLRGTQHGRNSRSNECLELCLAVSLSALKNAWENIGEVAFGGGVLRGLSKNL